MSVKEAADLLFAARGRIDFYWNFYVIVVIAVIGWLITLKRPLTSSMRMLVTVAFLTAASMNLAGLYGSYTFAEALRSDLVRLTALAPLTETRLALERHSYLAQRAAAIWIHLVVGAAIVLGVWFARLPGTSAGGRTDRGDREGRERTKT
jgi:hypothetical protein